MRPKTTTTLPDEQPRTSRVRRLVLPLLAGATLLGLGGVAIAGPGQGKGQGKARGNVCAKLECSADQKQALRTIFAELRADTKTDREAIKRLHHDMATEWAQDNPDEAELSRLQGEVAKHHGAMAGLVTDAMMEVHANLTPAQRVTFAKLIERRGLAALRGGGRGKRGDGKRRGNDGDVAPE